MARNRIQFQPGLSMPAFLKDSATEAQCERALEGLRWPEGFRCPRCTGKTPYHLSCFGPLKELGKRQCAGSASQEKADAAFEPGKGTAIGFADTPMVGVGLLTGFFSVAVGLQRASSCPA